MRSGIRHHTDCHCLVCRLRRAEAENAGRKADAERWKHAAEFWYGRWRSEAMDGAGDYPTSGALDAWIKTFDAYAP